ncbi:MAG: sensor domain-containing diguanylate cyclase [Thermodesulfobacteriota bacterium]
MEEFECIKRKNGEPCRMNGADILRIIKKNDFENIVKRARDYEDYRQNCADIEGKMLSVFTVTDFFESLLPGIKRIFQMPHVWLTVIEGTLLADLVAPAMENEKVNKHAAFIQASQFERFVKDGCKPVYACNYTTPYAAFFPENHNFTVRSMAIMPLFIDDTLVGAMNFGHFVSNRFAPAMDKSLIEQFMRQVSLCLSKISAHERLRYLHLHDPLTGLLNRTSLMAELKRKFSLSLHHGKGLSVLFLDLDGFNGLNDLYGHEYGDMAVRYVAETIGSLARPEDVVARFTGDEFVLLLPDARGDMPEVLVRQVQDYLDRHPFDHESIRFRLSLYYGIASIDEKSVENAGQLLQTAYKRLKKSKTDEYRPLQEEGSALIYKIRAS